MPQARVLDMKRENSFGYFYTASGLLLVLLTSILMKNRSGSEAQVSKSLGLKGTL